MDDIILTIDIMASSLLAYAARVTAGGAVIRRVAGGDAGSYPLPEGDTRLDDRQGYVVILAQ
jgi:hypothetical protein